MGSLEKARVYRVSQQKVYTYERCFIPNHLVPFLCGLCPRLDEQVALFARVQKSTCAKVMPSVCIMLGLVE